MGKVGPAGILTARRCVEEDAVDLTDGDVALVCGPGRRPRCSQSCNIAASKER
jgi:hypothetical protein